MSTSVTITSLARQYVEETVAIMDRLDLAQVEAVKRKRVEVRRRGGRVFITGSGGDGAGHASHAVDDFRKIAGIGTYSPSDNVSELTARINDESWDTSYAKWLEGSRLSPDDLIMVFSVGGGDVHRRISTNLVNCILYARQIGARVCGIVGRDGGATARLADACVVIPVVNESRITPHTEGLQAVVWHLLVSDPDLQREATKWESVVTE